MTSERFAVVKWPDRKPGLPFGIIPVHNEEQFCNDGLPIKIGQSYMTYVKELEEKNPNNSTNPLPFGN